jgi:hypothetical protein
MQRTMVRRLAFVLLAAAVLTGTAVAARKDPRDPQKRFNAQDQAWARAIRIQRADLGAGDWRVEPTQDKNDDRNAPAGCKNPDLSDLVMTGEADNPDFSRNGSYVGSGSEVWSSERHAALSWQRNTNVPLTKCLTAALKQGVADAGGNVKVTVLSSGPISIGKLAPRQLTYSLRFRVQGPAATLTGRLSFYVFSRGRAAGMVMLMSFGKPLTPIPASLERRLATLVAGRLKR